MPLKLNVNNKVRTVDEPPDTPLLWVLRDVLDLKGTKYGCGIGVCGACTVLVDGKPVRSCTTHVGSVTGQAITTIEGLSADATHPVQQAWEDAGRAPVRLLPARPDPDRRCVADSPPHPTDADIDAAMSGNLCRCGTYPRIRQAIHHAAEAAQAHARKS